MYKSLKFAFCAAMVFTVGAIFTASVPAKEPVKIIYDTDMGNDIDDVFALAMLNNLEKRGEVELLAITITKDNQYAAPYIQLVNEFYNNPDCPIGRVDNSGVETFDGKFLKATLDATDENGAPMFPFDYKNDKTEYFDAVSLLRKTLAAAEDGSVVIAQVGFSTNLVNLLDSPADDVSSLTGRELAAKKVKFVSAMAGAFTDDLKNHTEYNIVCDIPSAKRLFAEWPTPIYVSGYDVGRRVLLTPETMNRDYEYVKFHPLKEAFKYYRGLESEQCTWDLTSILFAARPDSGYFGVSEP
ncbi:MAG: nucleoside hydrolase, partial [Thermoguttaceae bacterium]|nr:nucleoside hydrolase [Thermoguttaceae bacterium]